MECCAVKKQLPEASPSIHLTCHGSSQGKSGMGVTFHVCTKVLNLHQYNLLFKKKNPKKGSKKKNMKKN